MLTNEETTRGLTEALTKAFGVLTAEQLAEVVKPPAEDWEDWEDE